MWYMYRAMQIQGDRLQTRFSTLLEATQRLMGLTAPEELLQVILESVLRLFAAEACSVALIDETEQELAFAFTLGGAKMQEVRLPLGQGIIGWVAENGEGVVSNDVSQ